MFATFLKRHTLFLNFCPSFCLSVRSSVHLSFINLKKIRLDTRPNCSKVRAFKNELKLPSIEYSILDNGIPTVNITVKNMIIACTMHTVWKYRGVHEAFCQISRGRVYSSCKIFFGFYCIFMYKFRETFGGRVHFYPPSPPSFPHTNF